MNTTKVITAKTSKTSIAQNKTQLEQILEFTGLTAEEYGNTVLDEAYNYLEAFLPSIDTTQIDKTKKLLTQSNHFWTWWVSHFEARDAHMLRDTYLKYVNVNIRKIHFQDIHKGSNLATSLKMYGRVLEQSYEAMVHQLIKQQPKSWEQ